MTERIMCDCCGVGSDDPTYPSIYALAWERGQDSGTTACLACFRDLAGRYPVDVEDLAPPASLLERGARWLVYRLYDDTHADIITDYLDSFTPDYLGACKAALVFARIRARQFVSRA